MNEGEEAYLLSLLDVRVSLFTSLLLTLSLLEKSLWNENIVLGWDSSVVAHQYGPDDKIAESELQLWCGILDLVIRQTRRIVFDQ